MQCHSGLPALCWITYETKAQLLGGGGGESCQVRVDRP